MTRIAIIGAGGFVGSRILELKALKYPAFAGLSIVPIVRRARGLARSAKFGSQPYNYVVSEDLGVWRSAMIGCDVAVNLTMGDNDSILSDLQTVYGLCRVAGVSHLIHISSAEVFGRCDVPGLVDDSPWSTDHWMSYARAKGRTEDWLRSQSAGPAVTVLRPGLIWGPRSNWVHSFAGMLMRGEAWTIDGGKWACNLCHVDNLVEYIRCASTAPAAGYYNVGDPDRPIWRDYWFGLAKEMGIAEPLLDDFSAMSFHESLLSRLIAMKDDRFLRALKKRIRNSTKEALKARILGMVRRLGIVRPPQYGVAKMSKSLWWLQSTRYHLPIGKFFENHRVGPTLNFEDGMAQTGRWLRFSGFQAIGNKKLA